MTLVNDIIIVPKTGKMSPRFRFFLFQGFRIWNQLSRREFPEEDTKGVFQLHAN